MKTYYNGKEITAILILFLFMFLMIYASLNS